MGLFSKLFQSNEKNFVSPMTGKVVAMSDIPDPAFAQKMMGDGCGIELTDGTVVAPFDAKVTAAFPTGHAFGLDIHENPNISSKSEGVLEENMVITAEPGIYIPGEFGVRIEDDVLVKKNSEVLTSLDKKLDFTL